MTEERAVCEQCGNPLPPQSVGRVRRYCSDGCRQAAHRAQQAAKRLLQERELVRYCRECWQAYNPEMTRQCEELLRYHGAAAAYRATKVVEMQRQEGEALARTHYQLGYEAGQTRSG